MNEQNGRDESAKADLHSRRRKALAVNRDRCLQAIESQLGVELKYVNRGLYATADDAVRIWIVVSQGTKAGRQHRFGFGYYGKAPAYLATAPGKAYCVFGCAQADTMLLVPFGAVDSHASSYCRNTHIERQMILFVSDGERLTLALPGNGRNRIEMTESAIPVSMEKVVK